MLILRLYSDQSIILADNDDSYLSYVGISLALMHMIYVHVDNFNTFLCQSVSYNSTDDNANITPYVLVPKRYRPNYF